ncbi:MAG: alpha,alpha-trehalase nth1 [Chrysothrix sp. TS-e1954]|nr:MAG: alpha,alpha-trehalase nth1 [Chrysothrix sp. TS-e1954]
MWSDDQYLRHRGEQPNPRRRSSSADILDGKSWSRTVNFKVPVEATIQFLLEREDTTGGVKITIEDHGPKVVSLGTESSDGFRGVDVTGTYQLGNLLQELVIAQDASQKILSLDSSQLREDPVDRIRRRILGTCWDTLTRRLDKDLIVKAAKDPKDWTEIPSSRIYIPNDVPEQFTYYSKVAEEHPEIRLEVIRLPDVIDAAYVKSLNDRPGVLALDMKLDENGELRGRDFIVPGGRFNELYYWDSYFSCLGLLESGRVDQVKDIVLNFCFSLEHYGMVLNASRSYYLGRSQPPFLTDLALRVYHHISSRPDAKSFLRTAMKAATKEYDRVWMSEPRLDRNSGLSRYRPFGLGFPPECEANQFDHVVIPRAKKLDMSQGDFVTGYNSGEIKDAELDEWIIHDRAVRESGHDTSFRLEGAAADVATIDLNALLYKYETDIAWAMQHVLDDALEVPACCLQRGASSCNAATSAEWAHRASVRKSAVDRLLWNEEKGMYFDFNTATGKQTPYESVTTLWALWSGIADDHQAELLVTKALPKFEMPGGLVTTTKRSIGEGEQPLRQWDYPFAWAPHQVMAWDGLKKYGYINEAERLAYRWLQTITQVAMDFNGMVCEKYDVTKCSSQHKADAEYGNQGRDFEGLAREGFGWTNGSYLYGLNFLSEYSRRALGLAAHYDVLHKAGKL